MEPQTPQAPINNEPTVISGDASGQPPQAPPPNAPKSKKRLVWLIIILVIIAACVVGWFVYQSQSQGDNKKDQKQNQQPVATNPDYGHIKVGSFRYVNACQVLPAIQEQNLFAPLSKTSLVTAKYAENTLPAKDIAGLNGVSSTCSRTFGSDTPYADTIVTFEIDQYPTASAAKKQYKALSQTQSDLNSANQRFGTNLHTNTAPLAGIANTVYDPDANVSYTLEGNKIVSFSALLSDVSTDQFKHDIVQALPKVLASVGNSKLKQALNQDPTFGQKIGTATYLNPCTFFTDTDFKQMTGGPNNPADVELTYNYNSTTYFMTDKMRGEVNNMCVRRTYPGLSKSQTVQVQVEYFKSSAEATKEYKAHMAHLASPGEGFTVKPVSGAGSRAAYVKSDTGMTDFYVQKGAYVLDIHATHNGPSWGKQKTPTAAEYTKEANVLLPKLH